MTPPPYPTPMKSGANFGQVRNLLADISRIKQGVAKRKKKMLQTTVSPAQALFNWVNSGPQTAKNMTGVSTDITRSCYMWVTFDREYLRKEMKYRWMENSIANCNLFCACAFNLVNFGPQTEKNRTGVFNYPTRSRGSFQSQRRPN